MPKFAANLSLLFTEVAFLDRFERAAKAGFRAVEFLFPYEHPAEAIKARLDEHGLVAVLFNTPPGDWDAGERGTACVPGRADAFRAGLARAVEYARVLEVKNVHVLAGRAPPDASAAALRRAYVGNLRLAAEALGEAGARALLEPINRVDMPGYYMNRTAQAIEAIAEIDAANVFMQYDIYHAQRSEGELAATIEKHLARIGHMQLADTPGRHEPGTGEINYPFLFEHIDRIGYTGHIGCEYRPRAGTEAGLGWLAAEASRQAAATSPVTP